MTPNTLYLTKANYFEGKRRVAIEFSNYSERRTKSFPFFPSFFIEKKMPLNEFQGVLSHYNPQKFRVKERKHSFEVIASTFTDLKRLANLCLEGFSFRPLVLEPERQFLISHNWSYFDSFQFFDGEPIKSSKAEFPKTRVEATAEPFSNATQQLLAQDRETALELLKALALSNTLRLPLESVPDNDFLCLEVLLENALFKHGFPFSHKNHGENEYAEPKGKAFALNTIKKGFSEISSLLLTQPFYNLGFDSINCECCKPKSAIEENVLPHSRVLVKVLSEGLYFESIVPSYAEKFHRSNPLKENRLRYKREFYLNYTPVGPFKRNQVVELLLCDALALGLSGKLRLLNETRLHWFCLRKESLVSKELCEINKRLVSISRQLSTQERSALKEHNLLAEKVLSTNLDFLFLKALRDIMHWFYSSIPTHLRNTKSRFFSSRLASALNAVELLATRRLDEMLKEQRVSALKEREHVLPKRLPESEKIAMLVASTKKPRF